MVKCTMSKNDVASENCYMRSRKILKTYTPRCLYFFEAQKMKILSSNVFKDEKCLRLNSVFFVNFLTVFFVSNLVQSRFLVA